MIFDSHAHYDDEAFAHDREQVLDAYRIAVEEKYRFFSFGDAMLVV